MNVKEFFSSTTGKGFLATASREGKVDIAVYSRPHVMDDGKLAFIMRDRLTHKYLQENDFATYAFIVNGKGYEGIRIFMKKAGEDMNEDLMRQMTRRNLTPEEDAEKGPKFLVYFCVEKILTLVGGHEIKVDDLDRCLV